MAHVSVAQKVRKAISDGIQKGIEHAVIPASVLQNIIEREYDELRSVAPAIFIVNGGRHDSSYSFNTDDSCRVAHFCGDTKRFVWLDVNAGPMEYGPSSSGEGGVSRHNLPLVDDLTQFSDKSNLRTFLVQIAGFIVSTSRMLFQSTPSHLDFKFNFTSSELKFVHIADNEAGFKRLSQQKEEVCSALSNLLKVMFIFVQEFILFFLKNRVFVVISLLKRLKLLNVLIVLQFCNIL